MKNHKILSSLLIGLSLSLGAIVQASGLQPLLMEGKKSLFQRVLTIPGANLYEEIDVQEGAEPVIPFTAFYVYGRKNDEGSEWLQVGTDRHGGISGWIHSPKSIAWNQALTVAFREPIEQDRALLFKDKTSLHQLVDSKDYDAYQQLYDAAEAGVISESSPVSAIQPAGKLDIRDNFYLVPIRQHQDVFIGNEQARMLEISSVPLSHTPKASKKAEPITPVDNYSAGLVFAIDSTLSMDPYIDRTREAVMKIYDSLGDAGLLGNVNFGLVAFRDNVDAAPELDYLAQTFVTLDQGRNPGTFLSRINTLSAATGSSQDFVEDSYAGVKRAIEDMNWSEHAARYLVVITDAGPRDANDPLSSTGLNAAELSRLAREKGIAIFVMHLATEAQQADYASAQSAYKKLSEFPGLGSLYYTVPTGDVDEFGHVLDSVAGQITMQVQVAGTSQSLAPTAPVVENNTQLAELQSKVAKLGHALRMRYLQKTEGGQPPAVFNAWLLDRDIRRPELRTLDVQVLLTRDQLSDLHDILNQVLLTAEEGLLSPQNFLNELKSLAATISRDPEQIGKTTAITAGDGHSLADLGFMREYIEDLPYTGETMTLSIDDWESWPAREQIAFLHRLEDKISYYRALHDHTDLWVSLDGGAVDGDSVFPVALEMLP